MKAGIMQPYFFPYIGYFQLIHAAEQFIFFDTPQYERKGWMNRNRILNLNGGTTYITVPLQKAPRETPLCQMRINNREKWRERILNQLEIYKKKAPYYQRTVDIVRETLDSAADSLSELNIASILNVCSAVGLDRNWSVFSKMDLEIPDNCEADEWALEITRAIGGDVYINAPGGAAFFDRRKYEKAGIDLKFLQPELQPYVQRMGYFEPGLSIIDVLMFNSAETVCKMLEQYRSI